jgi:hypothetical protein
LFGNMKALAAILIFALAPLLWGGEIPGAIRGTWVVKGCRFPGTYALSEKEAKSWIGKTLVIGDRCVSLKRATNSSPRFRYTLHTAETYFIEGFRFKPSAVGYKGSKVREYQITQADGKDWVEPGSTLIILSDTEALACWDGVFFVLQRRAPNERRSVAAGSHR